MERIEQPILEVTHDPLELESLPKAIGVVPREVPHAPALRRAQLWRLREGKKRGMLRKEEPEETSDRAPPFFWAGFILLGDRS